MEAPLFIDARKAFDSGIGTYVRNVVPRVLTRLHGVPAALLIARGTHTQHESYLGTARVRLVELASPALGLREQLDLHRLLGTRSLFWATSLAHPLYTRCRLVAMVHDVAQLVLDARGGVGWLTREASRRYFASIRARASSILFNSEFTRQEFLRTVGQPRRAQLTVAPLGVDRAWAELGGADSTRPHRPYFLTVGNVRPHKNLRALLAAFARVMPRVPHELVIVGQSEGFRTSDPGVLQLLTGLRERVRFLGKVSDAQLHTAVSGADAMVLPSVYEGFGLPALEAMASGCPVIASRAGALPEVCGSAARYFDPYSPRDIAQALVQHAEQPQVERALFVAAGRERALCFNWERTAELTARAISQCL